MKIEINFPRNMEGQRRENHEFSRVPCEGETIALRGENRVWTVNRVIHAGDPAKGEPVATIIVK